MSEVVSVSGRYLLAIDEGTTGTRALAIDEGGRVRARAYRELGVAYPKPGWVEQSAGEIWEKTCEVLAEVVRALGDEAGRIEGIAISNQRETAVMWDRETGSPLHPAVVWQCRRTEAACRELKEKGAEPLLLDRTGLPVDPYFSATKMSWMLDAVDGARQAAERGSLALGTVDSWLLYNLTGGRVHRTDVTNASRTQLLDIHKLTWDPDLCELFGVPRPALPELMPSGAEFGRTRGVPGVPDGLPILSMIGDSQAALFGETALEAGMAKVTYGTGSSVLIQTGARPVAPRGGLASTVAWQLGDETAYALEGIVHTTGEAVRWLRDGLGIIEDAAETEAMALSVPDAGGVWFVPAFTGLGTPWWDSSARGLLIGITSGTRREHVVRAVLNSIALQVRDVFATVSETSLPDGAVVYCGGGGSRNRYLMQLQADLLGRPLITCSNPEASSMGAAFIAGITAGIWDTSDVVAIHEGVIERRYMPQRRREELEGFVAAWHRAVKRSLDWAQTAEEGL